MQRRTGVVSGIRSTRALLRTGKCGTMVLDTLQAFKDDVECVIRRSGNANGGLADNLLYLTDQHSGGAELLTIGGSSGSGPFSSWPVEDRRILCRSPCIYRMLA